MNITIILQVIIMIACVVGGYYATVALYKYNLASEHRRAVASCKDEFGRIDYEKLEQVRADTFMRWIKFTAETSRNFAVDGFVISNGLHKMIEDDSKCPIEEYAARYDKKDKRKIQVE